MNIILYDYQAEALAKMKNGCILNGGVGSGKSITSIAYYFTQNGGHLNPIKKMTKSQDLYIITTARKRDTFEWEGELSHFSLSTKPELNLYSNKVVVDSWNNIKKYEKVKDAFFIFDEQRVVGKGTWVKAFLKIANENNWILLSATPGDTWSDYIPVFLANKFYKNRTEFTQRHIVYRFGSKYPQIDRYLDTGRLIRLRDSLLVDMDYRKKTESNHVDVWCDYDKDEYKKLCKERWNYIEDRPIESASEFCLMLRRICNTNADRLNKLIDIVEQKKKVIIFYNFDYELYTLKEIFENSKFECAEWNGHKHQPIPEADNWVYLVQYNAGNEGWNCIKTDTIIFYSQNYSYKVMVQAAGRIDRLNTPFTQLYYYHLKSRSGIDLAISRALKSKKKFNEQKFMEGKL